MRRLPLVLALAACAAAPLHAQEPWRALVGCWRTERTLFSLDSIPFVGVFADEEGSRSVRSGDKWNDRLEKMWRMPTPDSVRIRFEHGMYGWTYHLAVRGDSLAGVITSVTDVVVPGSKPRGPEPVRATRVPCPPDSALVGAPPDSAALADLYGYTAVRPTDEQIRADPWRAVAPLRAWLLAHPQAAATHSFHYNAAHVFRRAADYDVRAHGLDLVGTYRFEVQRTGGPALVFYGRTDVRPWYALRPDSTDPYPARPPGYRLRLTLSRDSAALPRPGPGLRHRQALGGHGAANSYFDVRLPPARDSAGALRFRGSAMLLNFAGAFHAEDRELSEWDHEWYRQHNGDYGLAAGADIVVWPDGRVTLEQREELAPDRVVILRAERISTVAWECTGWSFDC
ncbi:MAG TPA: hypothetical protein VJT67_04100 [Longimicrobiaceae bacterium]|nr:hypothetical protein [Longimicrobiaceae bacterium]